MGGAGRRQTGARAHARLHDRTSDPPRRRCVRAGMLCRENKSNKSSPKDDKVMLEEVHAVLLQYYRQWYSAFMFYAG